MNANSDDVENDDVIATAVRGSLLFLMALGLPLIGVLVYLNMRPKPVDQTLTIAPSPTPRRVDTSLPSIRMTPMDRVTTGIDFVHRNGATGEKLLPETMGSGVAVLDYDGDGRSDLFFVNSTHWPFDTDADSSSPSATSGCRLYRGLGEFQFEDVTESLGIDLDLYGMGVAAADYDSDGDVDIYVTAVGENHLIRNDGDRFVDVTDSAGVGGDVNDWGTSCGFFDYDNDGRLDLFVCNYVDWSPEADRTQSFTLDGTSRAYGPPRAFPGSFCTLYRNIDGESFVDVSSDAAIEVRNDSTGGPLGKSLGLVPVDYDDDGWMDVIVANDTVQNFCFHNNRDGTFTELASPLGVAFDRETGNARGAMGIDAVRFRPDGTLAIGIGNFANEANALYITRPGRGVFVDAAMATGFGPPSRSALTFGLFFVDVDLDGRPDAFGANGHLEPEVSQTQTSQRYAQPPQLFWNAGSSASSEMVLLTDEQTGEAFTEPIVARGAAQGDFDGDGDADLVVTTSGGPPRLFRNDQALSHHWVRFELRSDDSNRHGIGAVITIRTGEGERDIATAAVMPTKSYLSQSETAVAFGLGTHDQVDSATVRWAPDDTEVFTNINVDALNVLHRGQGSSVATSESTATP